MRVLTQSQQEQLQEYVQDYFQVSSAYRGQGDPMTVGLGLAMLRPITQQTLNPILAYKASVLTMRIIVGGRRADHHHRNPQHQPTEPIKLKG